MSKIKFSSRTLEFFRILVLKIENGDVVFKGYAFCKVKNKKTSIKGKIQSQFRISKKERMLYSFYDVSNLVLEDNYTYIDLANQFVKNLNLRDFVLAGDCKLIFKTNNE